MFKKKLITIGLLTSLCLGLSACGTNGSNDTVKDEIAISTEVEESSEVPSDVINEVIEETSEVSEPNFSEEVVIDDTNTEVDEYILQVFDEVKNTLGEDYFPEEAFNAEYLETMCGLTPDMYESFYGEVPMISVNVDFLIGVKASEGSVDLVYDKLNEYVESLKNNTMQYPMNAAVLPAATVVSKGDYVFAIGTFGYVDHVAEDGEDAILNYATDNVNKVVDIIGK